MVWYDGGRGAPPGCYCHARSLRAPAPKLVDEGGREEGGGRWEGNVVLMLENKTPARVGSKVPRVQC